jgi:hypothetical protein
MAVNDLIVLFALFVCSMCALLIVLYYLSLCDVLFP